MTWGRRTIQGRVFDWTHLNNAVIDVSTAPDGRATPYRVLVAYGHHVFAREVRPDDHPDFHVTNKHGNDHRCVCPIRTELSKNLPRIIRQAAAGGMAYFSLDANMLLVDKLPGLTGPYVVFFSVRHSYKKPIDVVMFVASAYEKQELPERLNYVPFGALIAKAASGKKPFRPTKTKNWKIQLAKAAQTPSTAPSGSGEQAHERVTTQEEKK